jgi:hypothetical protein
MFRRADISGRCVPHGGDREENVMIRSVVCFALAMFMICLAFDHLNTGTHLWMIPLDLLSALFSLTVAVFALKTISPEGML